VTWLTISAIATLIVASYLAALILALHRKRRAALQRRFEQRDAAARGEWLTRNRPGVLMTLSLLRTAARLAFFVLVLVEVVGLGEAASLTVSGLLIAAGISTIALWLCSSVVGLAIAEHAGVGLIVFSMPLVRVAGIAGRPLAKLLAFIDEAVRRLSGANLREQVAEEELLRSIEETHMEGGLDEESAEMLENVVDFRSREVSEIMTPRTDIEGIELTNDLDQIRDFIDRAGHSRIPVYRGNLDQILGILYVKDLVRYFGSEAPDFDLEAMLRKPIVAPETKSVPDLLRDFQRSEVHMAIVIDEYGGTAGLVTIEDVLEEIVGEIHDEHEPEDEEEPTLSEIDESRVEVDGRYHIDDLNERLGLDLPEDADYDTVAGYVLATLGRVPSVGDSFEAHNARFTAIAATETHIQKVAIELLEPAAANGRLDNGNGNGNGNGRHAGPNNGDDAPSRDVDRAASST